MKVNGIEKDAGSAALQVSIDAYPATAGDFYRALEDAGADVIGMYYGEDRNPLTPEAERDCAGVTAHFSLGDGGPTACLAYHGDGDMTLMPGDDKACIDLLVKLENQLAELMLRQRESSRAMKYMSCELGMKPISALRVQFRMDRHPDILAEFESSIDGRLPGSGAVSVEGYTAADIIAMQGLNLAQAYDYLIYLREQPSEALMQLEKGLPIK